MPKEVTRGVSQATTAMLLPLAGKTARRSSHVLLAMATTVLQNNTAVRHDNVTHGTMTNADFLFEYPQNDDN